jgi:xylan 1,4-beta-xylosidase
MLVLPPCSRSGSKTVFHYRGNVTPPKDYNAWGAFIHKLVRHWLDRYGVREVSKWFFEVWNEPNLKAFWTGTQKDYFKLYRVTADAIKTIDPSLKVGGPATAFSSLLCCTACSTGPTTKTASPRRCWRATLASSRC